MYTEKINPTKVLTITLMIIVSVSLALVHLEVVATTANGINQVDNSENNSTGSKIQYYLCTDYGDIFHCDPSLSALKAFEISGGWSEIYRPSGMPTYVDGKYGKALMLEAFKREESVEVNNTKSINPMNFSISFWIKGIPNPQSADTGAIISHSSDDNDAGWDFIMSGNGTISFEVTDSSGNDVIAVSDGVSLRDNDSFQSDEFSHIVGTFNGTVVSIYSNGHLAGQHAYNGQYIADPESPLKIGVSASATGSLLWTGIIDDLALYNRTLDQHEIRSIYESTSSYHNRSFNGLTSHWSFDETLDDTSASNLGNNGILRNLISSMAFTPDGRLFFSEKNTGQIRIMESGKVLNRPFTTIPDHYVDVEQGLLGLSIDPSFEKNHYVYLYYTAEDNDKGIVNRLIRFTDINNTGENKVTLIDNIPATPGYHSGGGIAFGPDDKLYLGVGDATISEFAQSPSVLLGKVLRINRDGTIPNDNPFPNSPVYTMGHRNIYGIAFDNKSGLGLIAENGDELYDEINLIFKGGNYGFPTLQPPNIAPELADSNLSVLPVRSYWGTPAPTQTIYYDGDRYPELKNQFLVGTFDGDIYALKFDTKNKTIVEEQWIKLGIYPYSAVIAIAASPVTGDIYFAGNAIYKLTSMDLSNKEQTVFPVTFSFSTDNNNVTNLGFLKRENASRMIVEFQTSDQDKTQTEQSELVLHMEIPKDLLYTIYNISTIDEDHNVTELMQPIEFTIDGSTDSGNNIVDIKYLPSTTYRIEILATDRNGDQIDAKSAGYDNLTESVMI